MAPVGFSWEYDGTLQLATVYLTPLLYVSFLLSTVAQERLLYHTGRVEGIASVKMVLLYCTYAHEDRVEAS